jgi:hypothetical protein
MLGYGILHFQHFCVKLIDSSHNSTAHNLNIVGCSESMTIRRGEVRKERKRREEEKLTDISGHKGGHSAEVTRHAEREVVDSLFFRRRVGVGNVVAVLQNPQPTRGSLALLHSTHL